MAYIRENRHMLRRPILALGIGFLVAGYAVFGASARGQAAEPAQAGGHEGRVKAEAEPGHAPAVSHAPTEGHSAEAEEKPNPMKPEPTLAIWTVLVFLGLFFVLGKFAWGPLSQALHQREEHLEHCLLQTEKARNESEQLLAEHRRLMAQADDRVKAIFDKAHKEAQASGDEIVKQAQAEAEAARDRAQREIATARDQALAEIWSQTANVAVSVAGRVLNKQLDANEHRRLLDLAIKELPASPVSGNGHGGTRG
jgi:F-type H+-transporting ATPase subunit b